MSEVELDTLDCGCVLHSTKEKIRELEHKAALWDKVSSSSPGCRFTRDDETGYWYQDRIAWGSLPMPEHPTPYSTLEEALVLRRYPAGKQ